jgi:hypothetical protein
MRAFQSARTVRDSVIVHREDGEVFDGRRHGAQARGRRGWDPGRTNARALLDRRPTSTIGQDLAATDRPTSLRAPSCATSAHET